MEEEFYPPPPIATVLPAGLSTAPTRRPRATGPLCQCLGDLAMEAKYQQEEDQQEPRPRGFPEGLPFIFDWSTLQHGTNFTFITSMGDVDLLVEVKGIGNYNDLIRDSIRVDLDGFSTYILSIPALIIAKEAAARPKDEAGLKVLYALQDAEKEEE